MAITQIIAPLSAVLNDSETFYEDIAVRNNSLVTVSFPSVNTWATQANALAVEVNDKAAQVAAQAVDGGYSQNYINDNFVGVNNAQDVTEVKTFIASPIVPTPTTDHQVANKKYVDDNNKINTLTNKTTPVDADEMVIADSASSFSLKKLSFSNLKAVFKTYFDTLYNNFIANDSRVKTALNAGGDAPIYACRAWVNFNGTETVAIRASGNVSSITDNGVGDYTVILLTALQDTNYSVTGTVSSYTLLNASSVFEDYSSIVARTTSSVRVATSVTNSTLNRTSVDADYINININR